MKRNAKPIVRVQTGVRLEKRLLKTLKTLAAYKEMGLGELLEGIVLHAFDGKPAFGPETLKMIAETKALFGLDLSAADSHKLYEGDDV